MFGLLTEIEAQNKYCPMTFNNRKGRNTCSANRCVLWSRELRTESNIENEKAFSHPPAYLGYCRLGGRL